MQSGTVKWFNKTKGYGFVAPSEGGDDVFLHISVLEECGLSCLEENDKVSFEISKRFNDKVSVSKIELLED